MFQISTALIALNSPLKSQTLFQILYNLKVQVLNKTQINTKENTVSELETSKPTFLILSTNLPGAISTEEILEKVKQVTPNTKTILVVNDNDLTKLVTFFTSNVNAIIFSDIFFESLDFAVRQLLKGQTFLCSKTSSEIKNVLKEKNLGGKFDTGLLEMLTGRELEVLNALTQGINYKQISKLLFISESTVKTHINNIFTKLNVNDRTQAVLYALNHGISNLIKKPYLIKDLGKEAIQK